MSDPAKPDVTTVELPVTQAQMIGLTPEGGVVFAAQFVFPPGFFQMPLQLVDPKSIGPVVQRALNMAVVPQVQISVVRDLVQLAEETDDDG